MMFSVLYISFFDSNVQRLMQPSKLMAVAAARIEQHVLLISGTAAPLVAVRGHFTSVSLQKSIHTIRQPVIMSLSQVSSCNQTSPIYILTKQYRLEHSPSSVLKT